MVAVPVDVFVVGDAGLFLGRPDFDGPAVDAEVVVEPVVEDTGDGVFGVVFEVVEDGDDGVAGELGAFFPEVFHGPDIFGRELVVGAAAGDAEDDAAEGVVGDAAADVGPVGDGFDGSANFGFGGGEGSGSFLLGFGSPAGGEVSVEVEALFDFASAHGESVEVVEEALGDEAVVVAAGFARLAFDEDAGFLVADFPGAVGVGDAHVEDSSVPVEVLAF